MKKKTTSAYAMCAQTTIKKLFLCKEGQEIFYVNAVSMEAAKQSVAIWNATVIKELPKSFMKMDPSYVASLDDKAFQILADGFANQFNSI